MPYNTMLQGQEGEQARQTKRVCGTTYLLPVRHGFST